MLQHRHIRLQKPLDAIRRAALLFATQFTTRYTARDAFRPTYVC